MNIKTSQHSIYRLRSDGVPVPTLPLYWAKTGMEDTRKTTKTITICILVPVDEDRVARVLLPVPDERVGRRVPAVRTHLEGVTRVRQVPELILAHTLPVLRPWTTPLQKLALLILVQSVQTRPVIEHRVNRVGDVNHHRRSLARVLIGVHATVGLSALIGEDANLATLDPLGHAELGEQHAFEVFTEHDGFELFPRWYCVGPIRPVSLRLGVAADDGVDVHGVTTPVHVARLGLDRVVRESLSSGCDAGSRHSSPVYS